MVLVSLLLVVGKCRNRARGRRKKKKKKKKKKKMLVGSKQMTNLMKVVVRENGIDEESRRGYRRDRRSERRGWVMQTGRRGDAAGQRAASERGRGRLPTEYGCYWP